MKAHQDFCPRESGLCMVLASAAGCSGNEIILFLLFDLRDVLRERQIHINLPTCLDDI